MNDALVGRTVERATLDQAFAATQSGNGELLLVTGEAGVGKTRLLEVCLAGSDLLVLKGITSEVATTPYGPIVSALRTYLRTHPGGLTDCGPLAPYLALLLPELGPPPTQTDRAALNEAICQAFAAITRRCPAVLVLDDLQWADNATLELVPLLASALAKKALLIIGSYRSDEIGRGHPLRRVRNELRRAHLLHEISIEPLDHDATVALAARILGAPPSALLGAALYECTEGLPLFVEELAGALARSGHLRFSEGSLALPPGVEMPLPDTLRDTILLQLDGLSEAALRFLETAAVAGLAFDLELLVSLVGGEEGLEQLFERNLIIEIEPERGAFRHALTREAIYSDISWSRRRALHRQLAEHLQTQNAAPLTIAQHYLAGKQPERARMALLAAVNHACAIHAYRDAADAAQRALELWPDGSDDTQRLDLLDQLGRCAQLCGLLSEAARAWREVADGRCHSGDLRACAETERKLANVAELQGHWERALAARKAAAHGFDASGLPAEAVIERLAAAAHLRSAARYRTALELLSGTAEAAAQAERPDLHARSIALEGNICTRMGQLSRGLALVQQGLALALQHNLASTAAEIYQRLADSLEHGGDYKAATETYQTAFDFCQTNAIPATAQLCVACLSAVLRQTGEWDRCMTLCRDVLSSEHSSIHARTVASGMLGSIYAMRGQGRLSQPLLLESAALAQQIELAAIELLAAWGLALLRDAQGDQEAVMNHCRFVLSRWEQLDDVHYVIPALRWSTSFFAVHGADADARACANALARIASTTGQPEALSALAHALGEIALLDEDAQQAVRQFRQALDILSHITVPYCLACTQWRAGIASAAANQRDAAITYLTNGYRTARKLGARPLATRIAQALEALDEPIVERLGQTAADRLHASHLTRRQREILQLVASGQTNAEIAQALVLSPRTVEMHVANILATLDSRSRTEAVRRATTLGLIETTV